MKRGVWNRLLGLAMRQGAVEMDSAPPATITSASPMATARMANRMASRPEAHWRSTVSAGTLSRRPAASPTRRAGLPPAVVLPRMISSTARASSWASCRAASTIGAVRSSSRRLRCRPPGRPSAVRRAAIKYADPRAVAEAISSCIPRRVGSNGRSSACCAGKGPISLTLDTTGSWRNPAPLVGLPGGAPAGRCYKCENDTNPSPRCLPGARARPWPMPGGGDGAGAQGVR